MAKKSKTSKTAQPKDFVWLQTLSTTNWSQALKKLTKSELQDLLVTVFAELMKDRASYHHQLEAYNDENKRILEQNAKLADEYNRLRNENEHLRKVVAVAIEARSRYEALSQHINEAYQADIELALLGVPFR